MVRQEYCAVLSCSNKTVARTTAPQDMVTSPGSWPWEVTQAAGRTQIKPSETPCLDWRAPFPPPLRCQLGGPYSPGIGAVGTVHLVQIGQEKPPCRKHGQAGTALSGFGL